ncbi:MAG: hypothetical protein WCT03_27720 [Candidatus Obscuribacterales bacterium]|jgi:hypothetical protein
MGYYVRVLSTSSECVPLQDLRDILESRNLVARLDCTVDENGNWTDLVAFNSDDLEVTYLERNTVEHDSLGAEELAEFAESVGDYKPDSAVNWLLQTFKHIKTIYAFQILGGTYDENGWEVVDALRDCIIAQAPSINQADDEGFTNFHGDNILWQFADDVKDLCSLAVLKEDKWYQFEINLENIEHRTAFLDGKVPDGVEAVIVQE